MSNDYLPDMPEDILWGVGDISAYIRKNERQTYWLLERKQIPAKKIGKQWVSTKTWLRDFIFAGAEG